MSTGQPSDHRTSAQGHDRVSFRTSLLASTTKLFTVSSPSPIQDKYRHRMLIIDGKHRSTHLHPNLSKLSRMPSSKFTQQVTDLSGFSLISTVCVLLE